MEDERAEEKFNDTSIRRRIARWRNEIVSNDVARARARGNDVSLPVRRK